ncbi:hypothetical protein [Burkholderia sp. Tr-20390]|uniref:hypothetical protein n=1 Tax=Burkholderia sp. Tr-20390 TaxID=2703904 RepID=UPI0019806D7E|nr:hypothetical protein [Burkholderia sp. Tr-20390]MBN3729375.1 hypothetical protein [Burkholderia sp. Tr-20390]
MTIALAKFDILPLQGVAGLSLTVRLNTSGWTLPEGVRVRSQIAKLSCTELEQTSIEVVNENEGGFDVYVIAGESSGDNRALVSRVSLNLATGAAERERTIADITDALQEGYQSAVFDAIGKLHEQQIAGGMQYVVGAQAAAARSALGVDPTAVGAGVRRWVSPGRLAFAAVMLVAAAMAGYGIYAKTRPPEDPISAALSGPDAQARMNAMIAGALKQPLGAAVNPQAGILQGQSVTLETLKAMGLDPGKANTGCLVGVKP